MWWTLLATTWALSPVETYDHELDVEIRSTASHDDSFRRFNDAGGVGTWGLRGAYALTPHVKLAASWAHGGRGVDAYLPDDSTYRSQLKVETFGLGLRGGWLYKGIVGPIATAQALGLWGTARMDEDPTRNDNPGQYVRRGGAFGFTASAGVEARVPAYGWAQPAASLEFGYLATTPLGFGELGGVSFDGLTVRGAVGARFR